MSKCVSNFTNAILAIFTYQFLAKLCYLQAYAVLATTFISNRFCHSVLEHALLFVYAVTLCPRSSFVLWFAMLFANKQLVMSDFNLNSQSRFAMI